MTPTPINEYHTLDALLVLGGEDQTYRPRSNTAKMIYGAVTMRRNEPLPIILSGLHSALFPDSPVVESKEMRDYLLEKGIPRNALFAEAQSMDTVGNFYHSQKYLALFGARRIGVVTDDYHMERALWAGKKVLGHSPTLIPVTTGVDGTTLRDASERISLYALRVGMRNIAPGDHAAINEYLARPHASARMGQIIRTFRGNALLKRLRNS
ncbi:TPA: YdcF family protein [Candidatus Woesearchaeota archaeon]|nr:YdcF family protein [Candidatus Woesearchaeota archaeon]